MTRLTPEEAFELFPEAKWCWKWQEMGGQQVAHFSLTVNKVWLMVDTEFGDPARWNAHTGAWEIF